MKQEEQSKLKIQIKRQLHEVRIWHKWQDNMNLYEKQRLKSGAPEG